MKFKKLLKYIPDFSDDSPAYLIKMDDKKVYLSHLYEFAEYSREAAMELGHEFGHSEVATHGFDNILDAPDISEVENISYMFAGCHDLTVFSAEISRVKKGRHAFGSCTNLVLVESEFDGLTDGFSMFSSCEMLKSVGGNTFPELNDGKFMFSLNKQLESLNINSERLQFFTGAMMRCDNLKHLTIRTQTMDLSALQGVINDSKLSSLETCLLYCRDDISEQAKSLALSDYIDVELSKLTQANQSLLSDSPEPEEINSPFNSL